jgi:hypothetical protein
MTDSNRADILGTVKTALQSITAKNGFRSTVDTVLRGIHTEDEFSGRMPGLCFWNERGPRRNMAQGKSERTLVIHVWGYVKAEGVSGDYDALDNLVADVEQALMTPAYNPYWDFTEIGETTYYEGGAADPIGIFEMMVEISYNYDFASP